MKTSAIVYVHHKARTFRFDEFMKRRGKASIISLLALLAFFMTLYLRQHYFNF